MTKFWIKFFIMLFMSACQSSCQSLAPKIHADEDEDAKQGFYVLKQRDPKNPNKFIDVEIYDSPYNDDDNTNPTNWDEIFNLDFGRYTTQMFSYHNFQNNFPSYRDPDTDQPMDTHETCANNYIRCLLSVGTPRHPLCVTNEITYKSYSFTFLSMCDMFHDNCLRGYRVWRAVDYGYCKVDTAILVAPKP